MNTTKTGAKTPQPFEREGHTRLGNRHDNVPGEKRYLNRVEIGGGDERSPPTRPRLYVGVHMYTVAQISPSEDLDV